MKRQRSKISPQRTSVQGVSVQKKGAADSASEKRVIFGVLFAVVLLSAIGLRVFKANHTGISYDEALTCFRYCDSVESALTKFDPGDGSSTNNHLLNSIFIHYSQKHFGSYEHYIRIPSLLAGIVFSLSIGYIVLKTIGGGFLRAATLGLVCFTPFVFDYSYLARGYALALGALYAAIAFVIWLLGHRIRYRWWIVPVMVISMLNFLAFGSMLSAMLVLAGFNAVFVLLYSWQIVRNCPSRLRAIAVNLMSIFAISFGLIFLLYRQIYKNILGGRAISKMDAGWKGLTSFVDFLNDLLIRSVFGIDGLGVVLFYAAIVLLGVAVLFHLYKSGSAIKGGAWRQGFGTGSPAAFMLIVTGVTLILVFVYGVILDKSLGRLRSQVFLVPQVLISCVIIMEKFGAGLGKRSLAKVVYGVIVVLVAGVTLNRLPSPYRFNPHSISGPLLRKLKAIDPDKTWSIGLSKDLRLAAMGLKYYGQFDYKFNFVPRDPKAQGPKAFDIVLYKIGKQPKKHLYLEWDYFSKFSTAVGVYCTLPEEKVVIDATPTVD